MQAIYIAYNFPVWLKYALLTCFSFLVVAGSGQPEDFRHYEVEEGLSNNSVICSLQDYQGFLWFGTSDGLDRFDGNVFKNFHPDPHKPFSLGNQAIICLFQDRQNRLWIGTSKGLYLYDAAYERFVLLPFTKGKLVRTVHDDARGRLWFADADNLYWIDLSTLYSPLGESFVLNRYPDKFVHTLHLDKTYNVTCMTETNNKDLWLGTEQGTILSCSAGSDNIRYHNYPCLKRNAVETLLATPGGQLLIGTSQEGLLFMDIPSQSIDTSVLTSSHEGREIFVRNILHYQDNEYWIATESGLYTVRLDTAARPKMTVLSHLQKHYTNPFSLSDNALYTLCKDKEGGVWIGSYFGGVNYLPDRPFKFERFIPMSRHSSLTGNVIREITRDSAGDFWIGTEDAGMNKVNFRTMTFRHILPRQENGAGHYNVHGLLADGNKIYAGTFNHGMDVLDLSGKLLDNYHAGTENGQLRSNFINAFCKTKTGEILVCTASGLYYFYPATGTFKMVGALPAHEFYSAITEDQAGNTWIGTHTKGVFFLKNGHWQHLHVFPSSNPSKDLLLDARILYLKSDKTGRIWIATENGLYRVTGKQTVKIFNTENGLPSNIIYALMPDSLNNMWLSTSKGLVKIEADGEDIHIYNKADGVVSNQFNYQSVYQDDEGLMYFGSVKGLIRFDPYQSTVNHYTPPLYFTDLHIFDQVASIGSIHSPLDKSLLFTQSITLHYWQSTFSLNFAALSYSSPSHLRFFYKIDEMHRGWTPIHSNDQRIYFTDLAPGNYTLRIRSTNSSGNIVPNEKVLSIFILPPFWKSGTAYALYLFACLLLVALVIYAYARYHSQKHKREIALYKLQHEKESYQSKVDFFTNIAHEIRTPLTLIKGPIDKILESKDHFPHLEGYLDLMERNTKRLLALTQDLLDFRKIESDMHKAELKQVEIDRWLQSFMEPYQLVAEQKHFTFSHTLPAQHFAASIDEVALSKIINNLLDNALKYAESVIIVDLYQVTADGTFIIQVKNDGHLIPEEFHKKIFEPFFRWNRKRQIRGSGIGLSVSHSLTQVYGGALNYTVSEEKYNCFRLTLPLDPYQVKDNEHARL